MTLLPFDVFDDVPFEHVYVADKVDPLAHDVQFDTEPMHVIHPWHIAIVGPAE